ncbi:MAG: hypothetical protein QOE05_2911 [Actinomycetota bacterium]|jgi:hypothetical protein|nr:hypothetical protein [Actinomycetota bacterium]
MRRLLALTVSALAVALALPAAAAPAESSRAAVVRLALPTDHGEHLEIELRALARAVGSYLTVAVSSCSPGCQAPRYYAGALPKGSLKIDASTADARLDAVVGGLALDVTWRRAERPGVVVGSLHGGGSGEDNTLAVYNGEPARAAVTVPSGSCTTDATVGAEHEVSTSAAGNHTAAPLSRLRLRPTGAPTCGG